MRAALVMAMAISAGAQGQWVTPAVMAPRVQQRVFFSPSAGTNVSYHVYTPAIYDTQPERRFPVLYWLHGSGSAVAGIRPVSAWFDAAIAERKIPPMIVVFPNGMPYGMWCNSASGVVPMEDVVLGDLLPRVDAEWRTIASPRARIVEGFSMGGYGAGRFGFKRPELFVAVSMLGAGPLQTDFLAAPPKATIPKALRLEIFERVYGSDPAYFFEQSPCNLAEQNAGAIIAGGLIVRQLIGAEDFTLPANVDFHHHLVALGIPHEFVSPPGVGHDVLALFNALGESNWTFYARALSNSTACVPNCDDSTAAPVLNALDFGCFLRRFAAGEAYANCDGSTAAPVLNALDFSCFVLRFRAGCP